MKADANTGLASPDVFYFGNLIGFAGEAAVNGVYSVTTTDVNAASLDMHNYLNPASITNTHDYSRDGRVDATDLIVARMQAAGAAQLVGLQAPVSPSAAGASDAVAVSAEPVATTPDVELDLSNLADGQGVRPRSRHGRRLVVPP